MVHICILHKHLLFIILNHITGDLYIKKNNKLIVTFCITINLTELEKQIRITINFKRIKMFSINSIKNYH